MKVLIVKVSALGDVVHALPVLPFIHSASADVRIDWLVEETFAPLLEDHPLIGKVHRLATKAWRKSGVLHAVKGALGVIRQLRRERYDVVLDLQGNAKSGLFTLMSGAPLRYGFDRDAAREWGNLLASNRRVSLSEQDFHITDRSLTIARAAFPSGTDVRVAGPLHVSKKEKEHVETQLKRQGRSEGPVVVCHYGTTWETKLWSVRAWVELSKRLKTEIGVGPLLTWGDHAEKLIVEEIASASGNEDGVWPRGTLPELVALLARADLVVGADTGPVHIAAAVGTPTVSLFRATDASRNAPRGPQHTPLQSPFDCSPCLRKHCDRQESCCESISTDRVAQAILSQLASLDQGGAS